MKMKKTVLALLVAAAVATPFAASAGESVKEGVYFGWGFGYSPASSSGSSNLTGTTGFSGDIHLGYGLGEYAAVEAGYTALGLFGWKAGSADVSGGVLSASVLGFYPVPNYEGTDVYGKIGYGNGSVMVSCTGCTANNKSKSAMTYGAGVEFNRGQDVSIRVGFDHYDLSAYTGGTLTANNYHLTINKKF